LVSTDQPIACQRAGQGDPVRLQEGHDRRRHDLGFVCPLFGAERGDQRIQGGRHRRRRWRCLRCLGHWSSCGIHHGSLSAVRDAPARRAARGRAGTRPARPSGMACGRGPDGRPRPGWSAHPATPSTRNRHAHVETKRRRLPTVAAMWGRAPRQPGGAESASITPSAPFNHSADAVEVWSSERTKLHVWTVQKGLWRVLSFHEPLYVRSSHPRSLPHGAGV